MNLKSKYIGQRFESNAGEWCTVVDYKNCKKVGVVFDGFTSIYWTRTEYLKSGELFNAENINYNERRKYFIGQRFYSKKHGVSIIDKWVDDSYAEITFTGQYACRIVAPVSNLAKGLVKNPMVPTQFGQGYFGIGEYDTSHRAYSVWYGMLERCYGSREQLSTYKGSKVSPKWLNYQSFAEDYTKMLSEVGFENGQLDKDLFCSGSRGKVYNPETCCILPQLINTALQLDSKGSTKLPVGVSWHAITKKYRTQISKYNKNTYIGVYNSVDEAVKAYNKVKSQYIVELAESYKDKLPHRTFLALLNKSKEILHNEY